MENTENNKRKVVIVGAGAVGSTYAYALAQSGLAGDIVIIDRNTELMRGQVMDLAHGEPFFPGGNVFEGDSSDYRDADLIVITAGAAQKPGESRIELLKRNAAVIRSVCSDIKGQESKGVILVVTNPVDLMTQVAIEATGWETGRVLGSGTVLDSSRLRHLLSRHCEVDVHNIHAYVLGEHGDTEFAAWSMTHIAGMPVDSYCPSCKNCGDWIKQREIIEKNVRESAYHIIGYKGATSFGVGMALVKITEAVMRDRGTVLTVSTLLKGEYGISDICLSVPCIVSKRGIEKVVEGKLTLSEQERLNASADALKNALKKLL